MNSDKIRYPRWTIDSIPYWEGCRNGQLLFQVCEDCAEVVFHARAACPYCLGDKLRWTPSRGLGALYSFSVQQLPADSDNPGKVPLTMGIVELDEGFHMFTEIDCTDLAVLKVGLPVSVYFDHVAPDLALPKFKLVATEVPAR